MVRNKDDKNVHNYDITLNCDQEEEDGEKKGDDDDDDDEGKEN